VLQALATPVWERTVSNTKTYKSGRVRTTTDHYALTGAQAIALMLGPAFLGLFLKFKDMTEAEKEAALPYIVTGSPFAGLIKKWGERNPLFGAAQGLPTTEVIKKVIG